MSNSNSLISEFKVTTLNQANLILKVFKQIDMFINWDAELRVLHSALSGAPAPPPSFSASIVGSMGLPLSAPRYRLESFISLSLRAEILAVLFLKERDKDVDAELHQILLGSSCIADETDK